jgi:hypothetical protein
VSRHRALVYVIEFYDRYPRRIQEAIAAGVTPMLAEKYMLLLETLRNGLPDRSQTHADGAPRIVSNSPHIPVKLPEKSPPTGKFGAGYILLAEKTFDRVSR